MYARLALKNILNIFDEGKHTCPKGLASRVSQCDLEKHRGISCIMEFKQANPEHNKQRIRGLGWA